MNQPSECAEFGISYLGATVRVRCDPPGLAGTLRRQFLAYGTADADPEAAAPAVTIHASGDRQAGAPPVFSRLGVPHNGGDLICASGVTLVHGGPPLSVVSVTAPDISVMTYDADPYLPFLHYLAKYPLRHAVEDQGAVLAHAAAVAAPGGGCCLFLGPSGAGKTTVFIEMLTRGFQALGNDATLLCTRDGGVQAVLWPHVVRIGEQTVRRNPVLRELPAGWAPRNFRDGKTEVFFDALDQAYGRRIAAAPAPVTAVACLTFNPAGSRTEIRELTQDAAVALLDERLAGDRPRTGWLPGWTWQPDPRHLAAILRLLSEVPAYSIGIGAAGSGWADEIAAWLTALDPCDGHSKLPAPCADERKPR